MSAVQQGGLGVLCGLCLMSAVLLLRPARARWVVPPVAAAAAAAAPAAGWSPGRRALVAVLAGAAAPVLLPGALGVVVALPAAAAAWTVLGRVEPAQARRDRESTRRDLPHLVALLGAALRSGAAVDRALRLVGQALPGPGAQRLGQVASRLELGADPGTAYDELAASDPELAGLARSLARAHRSGASVATAVERLAEDLARTARADVEDRARAVGVKAAVPLGLCLLPAFVLIGIVPLVAGLMTTVI